jgi:DinB superfamily
MPVERCSECGFDGSRWSDAEATQQVAELPDLWAQAISGIGPGDLLRRPIGGMWSIAEYTDHVRETTFGMRFVLDMVLTDPGVDLGEPPQPRFDHEPRQLAAHEALAAFRQEVKRLVAGLTALDDDRWASAVIIGGDEVDVHWMVRHALHDITHHLGDVERLRDALG